MKRFRLQNNVPDAYVKQSRDFQLMCNLFDLVNNGVKFDIDTITSLSDTQLCRDSMLEYLQHKLGLYMSREVTDETLRTILKCFPYLIKHKGSKQGVTEAIRLFLNIIYSEDSHQIEVINVNDSSDPIVSKFGDYVILVTLETNCLKDLDILDSLLKYVVPTGYNINYSLEISAEDIKTTTPVKDSINITVVHENTGNRLRSSDDEEDGLPDVLHGVSTTVIKASPADRTSGGSPLTTDYTTYKIGEDANE